MKIKQFIFIPFVLLLPLLVMGCLPNSSSQTNTNQNEDETAGIAFLYQEVGSFANGVSPIRVRVGQTSDNYTIESLDETAVEWEVSKSVTDSYGDPVFSRLSNGQWAMTAWTGHDDTRGQGQLLYTESSCPVVDDTQVIAIAPATETGCMNTPTLTGGKTSQIFSADSGNYVFHMISGDIYLAHLSDESHAATDLTSICVLNSSVNSLADLDYGESTRILDKTETGLLMSDTAMGRRQDGTWVLFLKGIPSDNQCTQGSTCELCSLSVYRTTSSDLIHWSELEEVVEQASVPEATTTDGTVWLYWQDFSKVCAAQNLQLSSAAPISTAYEIPNTYMLSESRTIRFADEEFETNTKLHYATNANPVALPGEEARAAFQACFSN